MDAKVPIGYSACPHDCPSTCALEVELLGNGRIGRVHGAKSNSYTAGVVCAKVARYAERVHHPDRLLFPLKRKGPKGSGQFERIGWDEAMDLTADAFLKSERELGPESVWPYFYAGTMGLVMRDGINRLRHAKGYAGQYSTFCTNLAEAGFLAGAGQARGPDPREMAKADLVVIWGTNPVNTQINVMTHVTRARKERGAKLVVVDVYRNGTMEQADLGLALRPGTDAALACAVMHILFRDGYANWPYLEKYTDKPRELERHLETRTPEWASRDHWAFRCGHRDVRQVGRHHAAQLFPFGLRLRAVAQRLGVDACRVVHPGHHRRLAARRRRRLPQEQCHLPLGQDADRRARCAQGRRAAARSIPYRCGADR